MSSNSIWKRAFFPPCGETSSHSCCAYQVAHVKVRPLSPSLKVHPPTLSPCKDNPPGKQNCTLLHLMCHRVNYVTVDTMLRVKCRTPCCWHQKVWCLEMTLKASRLISAHRMGYEMKASLLPNWVNRATEGFGGQCFNCSRLEKERWCVRLPAQPCSTWVCVAQVILNPHWCFFTLLQLQSKQSN